MKSRTEILVPLAAIQAVPIAVIAWYRLHRYAWYRYSAIVTIYGGYHFSRGLIGVCNPFSVCNALVNLRLNSYWIASGSNEMLLKVLRKFINEIPELDNCLIDSDYLEMSDVNMNDPKLFLYQFGYLTIKKVVGSSYMLGYPNREVRNAMLGMSLPNS